MKKIIGSIVISAVLNTVAIAQTSESFGGLGISLKKEEIKEVQSETLNPRLNGSAKNSCSSI
jgi:hypothetical protein